MPTLASNAVPGASSRGDDKRMWTILTAVSGLTVILVLIQAVLAGRFLYVDSSEINIHEMVANLVFLVVAAQAVVTFLARKRGMAGRADLILSLVLVVLTFAQIGIGYMGRDHTAAAAWHIPNGVLIFGLAAAAHTRVHLNRAVA